MGFLISKKLFAQKVDTVLVCKFIQHIYKDRNLYAFQLISISRFVYLLVFFLLFSIQAFVIKVKYVCAPVNE